MKLIIGGASGFLATETLRQSLRHPGITSVVALARKPVSAPEGTPVDAVVKLKSVCVGSYPTSADAYPDEVKKEFVGAGACIWTVAITPFKSRSYPFDEVRSICQATAIAALKIMHMSKPARPFRFVYVSGSGGERDKTKTPRFFAEYDHMRGETETQILEYAAALPNGDIEAIIPKPGIIVGSGALAALRGAVMSLLAPHVRVEEVAGAMIDAVVNGVEKDTLMNDDLVRIGRKVLVS